LFFFVIKIPYSLHLKKHKGAMPPCREYEGKKLILLILHLGKRHRRSSRRKTERKDRRDGLLAEDGDTDKS